MRAPLLIAGWMALPACGADCERGTAPCEVDLGSYYAVVPPGWDGSAALPVLVHTHGAGGDAASQVQQDRVTGPLGEREVLGIFPDGVAQFGEWADDDGVWDTEVTFHEQIVDDVAARWPVQDDRVFASGHSLGASMASFDACQTDRFSGAVLFSGGLWVPGPEGCTASARPVLRLHGRNDETWPVDGRDFQGAAQSPLEVDMAFWARNAGCTTDTEDFSRDGRDCTRWLGCDAPVEVCLDDGAHALPADWVDQAWSWLSTL